MPSKKSEPAKPPKPPGSKKPFGDVDVEQVLLPDGKKNTKDNNGTIDTGLRFKQKLKDEKK